MDAVVMAAGEGSRLRPLTELWPKPVLPIDGRPVIATLLRELAAAGIRRVFVVTGHLAEQVEELVGDGSGFGLEARFVRQPGVLGSADTVMRALAAGAEPPLHTALEINPGFAAARADLGWACLKQGRMADADKHFAQALEMDPLNALPRQQLEWRELLATGREN